VQADFARHLNEANHTSDCCKATAPSHQSSYFLLLNTRRDNVTIPGLNSRRFVEREIEGEHLG